MAVFWMQFIPWVLLMTLWMLVTLVSLFVTGLLAIVRWLTLWVEHGITVLMGASLAVLMRMRPVLPKGTKPPSNPTATAPVTEGLL